MPKIFYYTIMLMTLMVGMTIAFSGTPAAFASDLLTAMGYNDTSGTYSTSAIYIIIAGILTLSSGASIISGYFTKQSMESFIVGTLCYALLGWAFATFFTILNTISTTCGTDCSWITPIIHIIFWPLMAGYFIAIIQWWRGNDI